ncbi:MAG: cation:proton antiporter [Sphingomonas sp.]
MEGFDFPALGALLFVASLVAMASRRFNLPYSVGLVAAGIALSVLAPHVAPPLTPDLIYYVFLPPLVFEAAIQIPWKPLRRELPLLTALVTVGVIFAAGVVAAGMHWLVGWSWLGAGMFGVLIAATDPVAVISTFKSMKVEPRLHLLVEAESLLNDGVAAVGFGVLTAIAAAGGGSMGAPDIAVELVKTVAGGILAGAVVALALILVAGRTTDRLVEVTLTMLIAYGAFILAQHFGASGVLATLTAGLIVGNYGFLGRISKDGRSGIQNHWEFVAFLVNSLIFLMIGGHEAEMPFGRVITVAVIATVLSLAGRAAAVYPVMASFAKTRLRVPWKYKHVLFWGGLRGALALALSMAIPQNIPERDVIIVVSFAVVAFSIFVQGLTMPWLIQRMNLRRGEDEEALEEKVA